MIDKFLLFCFVFATSLFANSSTDILDTDIIPRVFNFLVFMGLLYYLLKDKIKSFLENRIDSIAKEQQKVQDILNESRNKRDLAKAKIEEANKLANEIKLSANKEVASIKDKIAKEMQNELDNIIKQYEDKKILEINRAKKDIANKVLQEIFDDKAILLDDDKIADILSQKVA